MGRWRGYAIIPNDLPIRSLQLDVRGYHMATNDRRSIRIKRASSPPPPLNNKSEIAKRGTPPRGTEQGP